MKLQVYNPFNILKQGDTKSQFKFKLLDYNEQPIDLTGQTVKVIIANSIGKILEKAPDIDETEVGVISFSFDDEDVTGYGDMRLEVHITDLNGATEIVPSEGYYTFIINRNLNDASSGVTNYTLQYFTDQFNTKMTELDNAMSGINGAIEISNQSATNADTKASFAQEQGEFAQTEASNLSQLKQDVVTATETAQQVATENKTTFLTAVATVTERDTTYPTPAHGDTVRVTSETKTYRYVEGTGWVVTDEYNPTAIDDLTTQMAQKPSSDNIKNIRENTNVFEYSLDGATWKQVQGGLTSHYNDTNTLINGDLFAKCWDDNSSSYKPTIIPFNDGDMFGDGTYINPDGNAPTYAQKSTRFLTPAGTTSVTFTVPAKLPSGVPIGKFYISILKKAGAVLTPDNSTVFTLTSTMTDYSITVTVNPLTEYLAFIGFNNNQGFPGVSQCKAILGRPRLKVNGATDLFASDHVRLNVSNREASDHIQGAYDSTVFAHRVSPYSRLRLKTNALKLVIEAFTSIYATYPEYSHITVLVDGRPYTKLQLSASNALNQVSVDLPSGMKLVEFVTGLQSKPSSTVIGTWIRSVYAPANCNIEYVNQPKGNALVFYGDSITVGGNSANPAVQGFPMITRSRYSGDVIVEGYGYRSLYDDCNTTALRTALVSKIAKAQPTYIWMAIGTNDYGLNKWNAASFGTAYASLLDDLHTYLPNTIIYCQTPISRTTETANASGNTLGDYRTQISTAVSTRSFCVLVDGTAILTTTDLSDGVHPTTIGHGKYGQYVLNTLGY